MIDQHALLLTDVVDSTQLSLRIGDAEMARLWAAHDRAARDLISRWHGREIDKTDGMLLLFEAAADAVGYAMAYQAALKQLAPPLEARTGLHVGPVTLRENSPADVALGAKPLEVEGVAKAIAARVMSVALGGQILLTAHARQSLSAEGLRLQSHGHWRLKGMDEPIELFEVGDVNAPSRPHQTVTRPTVSYVRATYGYRCGTSVIACPPSATPSSVVTSRCSNWREASMPVRAWCR